MEFMNRFRFFIVAAVLLSGIPFPVSAGPTSFVPFVSVKQEYSDNILFAEDEEEDFITTVSGGMTLKHKKELTNVSLSAQLDQLMYWDFDELDSLDKSFSSNVSHRATERLGFGASARYSEDSRRDRDTDTTGLLISGDREDTRFTVSSDYLFSERTKGDITLEYGQVDIDEINSIEDDDILSVNISFSRDLSGTFKNTTGILNLNYFRYKADIETVTPGGVITSTTFQEYISDTVQVSAGFSKDITELYNIYCQVGASYTKTDEGSRLLQTITGTDFVLSNITFPDQDDSNLGGVLSAGLNYRGLYYDMGLSLSQDMREASGTNGVVQRSSISGNIHRRVTDKLTLTLDASCYLNTNERESQADTEDLTINIQPGFRYRFSHDFILRGIYRFTSVDDRQNNTTRERNMIYVVIRKEFEI